jgi:membrane associated rhomboid family serine protease
VIPLRDDNPTRAIPYATIAIIALNLIAFFFWQPQSFTGASDQEQGTFFYCNALIPYEVLNQENLAEADDLPPDGRPPAELERQECPGKNWLVSVFTSMFLHGGLLHIGGNMLFLWIFGNNVEDKLRPPLYVLFYLGAGIAATIAQVAIVNSGVNAFVPNIGASGAIAGVLGAYLVMFPRRRVLTLVMFFFITFVYLPAFVVLGLWFILQAVNGVLTLAPENVNAGGGVAFWAHIGGFVFGLALAFLFFPKERFGATPPPRRPDYQGRWAGRPWRRRRPGPFDY